MAENTTASNIINSINRGQSRKAIEIVKSNPDIAAAMSKLIKPIDKTLFNRPKTDINAVNQSHLNKVVDNTGTRIKDNESILSLFPDIELGVQILISSIVSPKDMVKTELIYKTGYDDLDPELCAKLNEVIKEEFEGYYKIKSKLSDFLREMLFTSGASVNVVLPENIIDELINTNNNKISLEDVQNKLNRLFDIKNNKDETTVSLKGLGILSTEDSNVISLESFNAGDTNPDQKKSRALTINEYFKLEVTDNFNALKIPALNKISISNNIRNLAVSLGKNISNESVTTNKFKALAYKDSRTSVDLFVQVPYSVNAIRKTVGRPLIMKLPTESTIPVYTPGDEKNHLGYFVVLDIDGNPITTDVNYSNYGDSFNNINNSSNNDLSSFLTRKASSNLSNTEQAGVKNISPMVKVYSDIVEKDLLFRIKNGIYGKEAAIGENENLYRIMLSRSLANKFTRILFIPSEFITYFAFKYYPNGMGKSYLDDVKILTSLRAMLLFAKVMAETKNAINVTQVDISLDPRDPDPTKTIETAMHEVIKLRQNVFPLGINTPADLVNWVQRAGFQFTFQGHPGIPSTKLEFDVKNLQHTPPNSELDELLRKQTFMAFGLSPETVDQGFNVEFATTIVANNILLSKRVLQLQEKFNILISDWCKKVLSFDEKTMVKLIDIAKENKALIEEELSEEDKKIYLENKEEHLRSFVLDYLSKLQIELPKPDEVSLQTQTVAFKSYVESVKEAIDYWISSNFIKEDVLGELSSNVDSAKDMLVAYFVRKWASENNYLPELFDIIDFDKDDKESNINKINKNYLMKLAKNVLSFYKEAKEIKKAVDKDMQNLQITPVEGSSGGGDIGGGELSSVDTGSDLGLDTGGDLNDLGTTDDQTAEPKPDTNKTESKTSDIPEEDIGGAKAENIPT